MMLSASFTGIYSANAQYDDFILYDNTEYGFSINYPSDWQKQEQLSNDTTFPKVFDIVTFQSPTKLTHYGIMLMKDDSYAGLSDQDFLNKMTIEFNDALCEPIIASGDTCIAKTLEKRSITHTNGYSGYLSAGMLTISTAKGTAEPIIGVAIYPDGDKFWVLAIVGFSDDEAESLSDTLTSVGNSFIIYNYQGSSKTLNSSKTMDTSNLGWLKIDSEVYTASKYSPDIALVSGEVTSLIRGTPITLLITKSDNSVEQRGIVVSGHGSFSTPIVINYDWPSGNYSLSAFYGDNEIGTVYFQVLSENAKNASQPSDATNASVPKWIKNNAKWWADGILSDDEFIKGIEYLVNVGIIVIPQVESSVSESSQIPFWLKNTIKWWADGQIPDSDFINGIQYLVKNNLITIKPQQTATKDTPKETPKVPQDTPKETPPSAQPHKGVLTGTFVGTAHWNASFEYYDPDLLDFYTHTCYYSGKFSLTLTHIENTVIGDAQMLSYDSLTNEPVCITGLHPKGSINANVFGSRVTGKLGELNIDASFITDSLYGNISGKIGTVDVFGDFDAFRVR